MNQLQRMLEEDHLYPLRYLTAPELTHDTRPPAYSLRLVADPEVSLEEFANLKIYEIMALKGAMVACEYIPGIHPVASGSN